MHPDGQNLWQGTVTVPPAMDDEPEFAPPTDPVSWQASEFVHYEKDARWFVLVVLGGLAVVVIAAFFAQSLTFTVVAIIMTITAVVMARRQPHTIHYSLTTQGLQIGDRLYHYNEFQAFGIVQDGPLYSVVLIPTRRFMPAVNIYFAPEDGERIVDMLGAWVPMEEIHLDFIDRMVRHVRF